MLVCVWNLVLSSLSLSLWQTFTPSIFDAMWQQYSPASGIMHITSHTFWNGSPLLTTFFPHHHYPQHFNQPSPFCAFMYSPFPLSAIFYSKHFSHLLPFSISFYIYDHSRPAISCYISYLLLHSSYTLHIILLLPTLFSFLIHSYVSYITPLVSSIICIPTIVLQSLY